MIASPPKAFLDPSDFTVVICGTVEFELEISKTTLLLSRRLNCHSFATISFFFFLGAFNPKNLELLCCRYLANIPSPSIGE